MLSIDMHSETVSCNRQLCIYEKCKLTISNFFHITQLWSQAVGVLYGRNIKKSVMYKWL